MPAQPGLGPASDYPVPPDTFPRTSSPSTGPPAATLADPSDYTSPAMSTPTIRVLPFPHRSADYPCPTVPTPTTHSGSHLFPTTIRDTTHPRRHTIPNPHSSSPALPAPTCQPGLSHVESIPMTNRVVPPLVPRLTKPLRALSPSDIPHLSTPIDVPTRPSSQRPPTPTHGIPSLLTCQDVPFPLDCPIHPTAVDKPRQVTPHRQPWPARLQTLLTRHTTSSRRCPSPLTSQLVPPHPSAPQTTYLPCTNQFRRTHPSPTGKPTGHLRTQLTYPR